LRFQLPNEATQYIVSTQKHNDTTEHSQCVTLAPFAGKPKITVKLTITRSSLLYVPVRIGDGYLDTLIDTGASCAVTDMSMLEIISKKDLQFSAFKLQQSEVGAIECYNGSHQEILGQFETTLQIGSVCFDAVIQVARINQYLSYWVLMHRTELLH
jgi:hypothetical protein